VLQYHRTAEEDGLVLAFRRHLSRYENYGCLSEGD
jgi:hypothetical protein